MNICFRQPRTTGSTAMPLMVLAVFLTLISSARSQSNSVTGTAYGTNDLSTAATISSLADGEGYLTIGYEGTTALVLSNSISGTISIDNSFAGMDILATGSTVSNWQEAVLSITGGTNLTIVDGRFIGLQGTNTFLTPPIPDKSTSPSYATNAAVAGWISGVQSGTLSNTWFEGTTYAPGENVVIGTDALVIGDSSNLIITGADSSFIGGNGDDVSLANNNTYSRGARGLVLANSSASIHNGLFQGGHAGRAIIDQGYYSESFGGTGIRVIDSTLHILDGTFTGGDADFAAVSQGGVGLFATDSDITIEDGIFTGGKDAGGKKSYGLYSMVTGGGTNNLVLNGGTFNLMGFGGDGTQYLTFGTNGLTVADGIKLDGGTLNVTNLNNAPFQTMVISDGTMNFSENFALEDGGRFYIASTDTTVGFARDYSALSGSTNWFTATTNGTGSITADNIYFENSSSIGIENRISGLPAGVSITSTVVSVSSGFHVIDSGGFTNTSPTAELFETNVNVFSTLNARSGLSDIIVTGDTLAFEFSARTLSNYWNASGQFAVLADEIDSLTGQNSAMLALIDEMADAGASGSLVEQSYFTTFNVFQTARQGMQAAIGQSASRSAEFREQLKLKPAGARGPKAINDLRGWTKYYSQRYDEDAAGLNPAYDSKLEGGTIGIDKNFGDMLLLGISGGAGQYLTTTGSGGKSDMDAYYGSLYGTLGIGEGYLDGGISYGMNKVKTRTASPFELIGDFDAELTGAYLGAGYDLVDNKEGMVFTPEVSVHYSMYEQDAYTETSDAAIPRRIESFEADSLLGSIGLNVSVLNTIRMDTFSLKYDLRAHWMHEFNPEPGTVNFTLDGGDNRYQFDYPMLDEEFYRVGAGAAFFNTLSSQPDNVLFRVDYDKLFGDGFDSHHVSVKLIYAF